MADAGGGFAASWVIFLSKYEALPQYADEIRL